MAQVTKEAQVEIASLKENFHTELVDVKKDSRVRIHWLWDELTLAREDNRWLWDELQ